MPLSLEQLYDAVAELDGMRLEEDLSVTWEYPGALCITLNDGGTEGYGARVVATPDGEYSQGEHDVPVTFLFDCEGHTFYLCDVSGIVWEEGKVEETYRAAVAQRLPEIRNLLTLVRDHGPDGLKARIGEGACL